jgi:hypothetical protein
MVDATRAACMPKVGQSRYDHHGPIRVMAVVDPYLMVRRPGSMPFVLGFAEWWALSNTILERNTDTDGE